MRSVIALHEGKTDADVRTLLEKIPDVVSDGRIIAHETIEALIGLTRDQNRYRTVTKHWRRALWQERQVFLWGPAAEGHGFKALTPDEMIRFSNREVRHTGRRLKRALLIAATPRDEEITDTQMRVYRARLLSATEQITHAHGRVLRELSQALLPPRQIKRVV